MHMAEMGFVSYLIMKLNYKGLMKMNHTYKQVIAPPEWPLNEVISFEEGVNDTFLSEEGVF